VPNDINPTGAYVHTSELPRSRESRETFLRFEGVTSGYPGLGQRSVRGVTTSATTSRPSSTGERHEASLETGGPRPGGGPLTRDRLRLPRHGKPHRRTVLTEAAVGSSPAGNAFRAAPVFNRSRRAAGAKPAGITRTPECYRVAPDSTCPLRWSHDRPTRNHPTSAVADGAGCRLARGGAPEVPGSPLLLTRALRAGHRAQRRRPHPERALRAFVAGPGRLLQRQRPAQVGRVGLEPHGRRIMSPLRILATLVDQCSSWPFSQVTRGMARSPSRRLSVFSDPCVQPASRTHPGWRRLANTAAVFPAWRVLQGERRGGLAPPELVLFGNLRSRVSYRLPEARFGRRCDGVRDQPIRTRRGPRS
jgi:hypothetical protein